MIYQTLATNIGGRIRQLRQQHGMTRLELAEATNQKIHVIVQLETESYDPTVGDLLLIAKALGVTMSELFKGVEMT